MVFPPVPLLLGVIVSVKSSIPWKSCCVVSVLAGCCVGVVLFLYSTPVVRDNTLLMGSACKDVNKFITSGHISATLINTSISLVLGVYGESLNMVLMLYEIVVVDDDDGFNTDVTKHDISSNLINVVSSKTFSIYCSICMHVFSITVYRLFTTLSFALSDVALS